MNMQELFSLEGINIRQEDKYSVLNMAAGKGKSYKGISWAIETALEKGLNHIVFVTSELSGMDLAQRVNEYLEYGDYPSMVDRYYFSFINTELFLGAAELAIALQRISTDKTCIVLDNLHLDNFIEQENTIDVLKALLKRKAVFGDLLMTQQLGSR